MRTFTPEELKEILAKHRKWLFDEEGGERADLRYADLSYADLRYADLRSANLSFLALWGVVGNMGVIRSIQLETYAIAYTFDTLQIGCEQHLIEEWKVFDDERIIRMEGKAALRFWRKWKDTIFQLIEMSPADKWEYKPETKEGE